MKRVLLCILSMTLLLSACGNRTNPQSGQNAPTWQEQYDLGIRYLSEGNYEEAIIAFTAAIKIGPNRAEAYVGRGDAYIKSGETEENLSFAQTDYEQAIELDETCVDAYLGLADVYILQGDYDKALEILKQALTNIGENKDISDKIKQLENKQESTLSPTDRFANQEDIEFIRFDDLDKDTQAFLDEILARQSDIDFIKEKMTTEYLNLVNQGLVDQVFRTFKDGYKIQLVNVYYDGDENKPGGDIEIRPENGTAYRYSFIVDQGQQYSVGACKNWNWNGAYETNITASGEVTRYSGTCVDGLLDGAIHVTPMNGSGFYDYYKGGQQTGKRIMDDGTERFTIVNYGENEVHLYDGVIDREYYQSEYIWQIKNKVLCL